MIWTVQLSAADSWKHLSVDASQLLFFLFCNKRCKLVIYFVTTLALVAKQQVSAVQALESGNKRVLLHHLNARLAQLLSLFQLNAHSDHVFLVFSGFIFVVLKLLVFVNLTHLFSWDHKYFVALWTLDGVVEFESVHEAFFYSCDLYKIYVAIDAELVLDTTLERDQVALWFQAVLALTFGKLFFKLCKLLLVYFWWTFWYSETCVCEWVVFVYSWLGVQ